MREYFAVLVCTNNRIFNIESMYKVQVLNEASWIGGGPEPVFAFNRRVDCRWPPAGELALLCHVPKIWEDLSPMYNLLTCVQA